MNNAYWFLHNFNCLVISVLAGWFISLHYNIIFLRIPFGLMLSSVSFWYLSQLKKWEDKKTK